MDPGWVLSIKDNWYGRHGHVPNPDLRERYSGKDEPKQDLIDEVEAWLEQYPEVKVGGAKSGNPGSPECRRRRSLDVSSNGLLGIRDNDFNVTHRLTDEELVNNVEIIGCAHRTCSKERRALE